jgi:hypothetical protein
MVMNSSPAPAQRSASRKVSLLIADVDGTLVTKDKIPMIRSSVALLGAAGYALETAQRESRTQPSARKPIV